VNVAALEGPPHVIPFPVMHPLGTGFVTVTVTFATAAMSAGEIDAVSPFVPTKVLVRGLPFHCTTEQGNKLLPFTERMKAAPPAAALEGASEPIDGTGKDVGAVIIKGRELELATELETKTFTVPREAASAYVMAAVSCVPLTNVVGRGEPFQFTTVSLVKIVPVAAFTVRVKPVALQYGVEAIGIEVVEVEAESDAMARGEIVNEIAADVPPPGVGVNTVTGTDPAADTSVARIVVLS
jgi:hypothetical protein